MLNDKEIDSLEAELLQSAIASQALKEDLLDHFCCFIEHEITKGIPFEESRINAWQQICPNGLDEIQRETIFLIKAKKNNNHEKSNVQYRIIVLHKHQPGFPFQTFTLARRR